MPKYEYDKEDWGRKKKCGYCGETFYPIATEGFCDKTCENRYLDYIDDYENWMLEQYYKEVD